MINGKIIAVFVGFAVLVALIAGGIRGVPFIRILLRTAIWAVVFGGIGLGVSVVVHKYLPELNRLLNGEEVAEKSYQGEFETIIPEENPHDSLNQDSMFSTIKDETDVNLHNKEKISEMDSDQGSELEELGAAEESGEELIEEKPIKKPDEMGGVPYIDAISEDEQIQEDNIDNLDILPELDSFASSFTPYSGQDSNSGNNPGETKSMYSKPKTDLDVGGFIEDPLKTAKAIHTWIERDKEG